MLYGDEMAKLAVLNDTSQLKENSIAATFRNNKYNLTMSAYSFQLLINFLQENNLFILLKIVNQYLNVRAILTRPTSGPAINVAGRVSGERDSGIFGLSSQVLSQINCEPLDWGVVPLEACFEGEIQKRLKSELSASGNFKVLF